MKTDLATPEPCLSVFFPEEGLTLQWDRDHANHYRVIEGLQQLLADEVTLYLKSRHVCGKVGIPTLYSLQDLSGNPHQQLDEVLEEIAERIRALVGYVEGSMHEYMTLTRLPELSRCVKSPRSFNESPRLRGHRARTRTFRMLLKRPRMGGNSSELEARMELLLLRNHELLIREIRMLIQAFVGWGDPREQTFISRLLEDQKTTVWMLGEIVANAS